MPLSKWYTLYHRHKDHALCIDIETAGYNKPITVVGTYHPKEGPIQYVPYIKNKNLTSQSLYKAFSGYSLFITFNGLSFDLPRLQAEYPGVIPRGIPVLDLYRIIRILGINTNLQVLENTLGIERPDVHTQRRRIAAKLWHRYETFIDQSSLQKLLDYNEQDTVNLFPIANTLLPILNTTHIKPTDASGSVAEPFKVS
ncbi:MAG: hypothetical protein HOH77_02930 [Candidatus Latescibacteria bacterium]|jgi:uncharacterized protein|nr:hypothetical protein [Candidatus Latescibacterota bacterium]